MRLANETPCGVFKLYIESTIDGDDDQIPGESIHALVLMLEKTAQTLRLACDPDLQRGSDATAVQG